MLIQAVFAAARRLLASGLTVAVLEARPRVGGRAVTVRLKGHPVDLGAHWLHAGPITATSGLPERHEGLSACTTSSSPRLAEGPFISKVRASSRESS